MNYDDEFSLRHKNGRFKSPHSGNRSGRPRKPHNLLTAFNHALTKKRRVVTNLGVQELAGFEMIAEAVVKKAAFGDLPSLKAIRDYLDKHPEVGEEGRFVTYAQSNADAEAGFKKLTDFIARVDARKAREAEAKKAETKTNEPDDGKKN
jgi:Family of unknown function (DUF5681)